MFQTETASIVTGASSGIGWETAIKLAEQGSDVAIAARREEKLNALKDEIKTEHDVDVLTVPTDVTDYEQVVELVDQTVAEFGSLDIVVPNAGVGRNGDLAEMDIEDYHSMIATNIDGTFYTAKESFPHLRESNGNLIFIGSYGAKYPYPYNPVYGGTKFFTRGFALSLAGMYPDSGVGITVINPSAVRTEYGDEFRTANKDRWDEGEVTEPDEVAEAITFAAKQDDPNMVNELDLFTRSIFG